MRAAKRERADRALGGEAASTPAPKPRRERSEAQIAAFERMRAAKRERAASLAEAGRALDAKAASLAEAGLALDAKAASLAEADRALDAKAASLAEAGRALDAKAASLAEAGRAPAWRDSMLAASRAMRSDRMRGSGLAAYLRVLMCAGVEDAADAERVVLSALRASIGRDLTAEQRDEIRGIFPRGDGLTPRSFFRDVVDSDFRKCVRLEPIAAIISMTLASVKTAFENMRFAM
jgi:hypothetical protein